MTETETNRAAVTAVMAILSGAAPIESGADLFAPDVVCNVDGWRFQGINVWWQGLFNILLNPEAADPAVYNQSYVDNPHNEWGAGPYQVQKFDSQNPKGWRKSMPSQKRLRPRIASSRALQGGTITSF